MIFKRTMAVLVLSAVTLGLPAAAHGVTTSTMTTECLNDLGRRVTVMFRTDASSSYVRYFSHLPDQPPDWDSATVFGTIRTTLDSGSVRYSRGRTDSSSQAQFDAWVESYISESILTCPSASIGYLGLLDYAQNQEESWFYGELQDIYDEIEEHGEPGVDGWFEDHVSGNGSAFLDTDGDGTIDSQDPDIDGDGEPNITDDDLDGDGYFNDEDTNPYDSTDFPFTDDDGDGLDDRSDDDGDGVSNEDETWYGSDPNDSASFPDVDGDAIPNHLDGDIDGDGIPNATDDDDDGDGVADNTEAYWGLDPGNEKSNGDFDEDGLFDLGDADGDGISDAQEGRDGTDPNDSTSFLDADGDGYSDAMPPDLTPDGADDRLNSILVDFLTYQPTDIQAMSADFSIPWISGEEFTFSISSVPDTTSIGGVALESVRVAMRVCFTALFTYLFISGIWTTLRQY